MVIALFMKSVHLGKKILNWRQEEGEENVLACTPLNPVTGSVSLRSLFLVRWLCI